MLDAAVASIAASRLCWPPLRPAGLLLTGGWWRAPLMAEGHPIFP